MGCRMEDPLRHTHTHTASQSTTERESGKNNETNRWVRRGR